jgi:hypothetical protein
MFSPAESVLYGPDQLNELVNFTQTITYTNDEILYPGETWVVSIIPDEVNSTVNITGGTISGYYSSAFDGYSITYLNRSNEYKTVPDWSQIADAREIVNYTPAMIQYKTFNYTATATSSPSNMTETKQYQITVTNNWTVGLNSLKAAIAQTIAGRT